MEKGVETLMSEGHRIGKTGWTIIIAVLLMAGIVLLDVWGYLPFKAFSNKNASSGDDQVTDFSDDGMRVGNNVYGYIDVPEGFTLAEGSFNPANEDYAGIRGGQRHGVWLYNEAQTESIWISMIESGAGLEDYIGFGMGEEILYGKKMQQPKAEKIFDRVTEKVFTRMEEITGQTRFSMTGEFLGIRNMKGMSMRWEYEIGNNKYSSVVYLLEDPDNKNRLHCISTTFTGSGDRCINSLLSFALEQTANEQGNYMAKNKGRIRLGDTDIGYMSLPASYEKVVDSNEKELWWEKLGSVGCSNLKRLPEKDSHFVCFIDKEEAEEQASVFQDEAVLGVIRKSERFSEARQAYLDTNLSWLFTGVGLLDYYEAANLTQYQGNWEFNANFFACVTETCLAKFGKVKTEEVTVDGKSGYLCTWEGSYSNHMQGSVHFYILDDGEGVVRVAGIGQNQGGEELLRCLESYSVED